MQWPSQPLAASGLHPNQPSREKLALVSAAASMPCQSNISNISLGVPSFLPHHRQVHSSSPPILSPPSTTTPSYPYRARSPALTHTYTHLHPSHLTLLHLTSLTPGDHACVVAVRSFPLLVVLLRRRIHTPVRCLCCALCEFDPPRYPGMHPPSAPALRSPAACADTISLPPQNNTIPCAHLHDLKPSCPAFPAIPIPIASIHPYV